MHYSMILVPSDPFFHPDPERIVSFLGSIVEMGAVGSQSAIRLRNHQKAGITLLGRNPRTGDRIRLKSPKIIYLDSVKDFPKVMEGLTDFDAVIEGIGPARVLPIRNAGGYDNGNWKALQGLISSGIYTDEYELSVECCQRS